MSKLSWMKIAVLVTGGLGRGIALTVGRPIEYIRHQEWGFVRSCCFILCYVDNQSGVRPSRSVLPQKTCAPTRPRIGPRETHGCEKAVLLPVLAAGGIVLLLLLKTIFDNV